MQQVSNRLKQLSESATLAMARMSRELKAQGHNVIALSLGEPDFDTPEFIKESAKQAIDNNYSHYTPVPGLAELREAICKKLKRDNQLEFNVDQIVVSTGAKQSIANVCLSLLNSGDEVILPAPYWVSYFELVKLGEATPVVIKSSIENDFKMSPQDLEKAITPNTKMIIFSSPCNPSGTVYSQKELEELAKVLEKHPQIYVISDEIYELINFGVEHYSMARIDSIKDRVITVNGVSKGFAMTGWRVGYIAAPQWIASACNKIQGQVTSATCAIAQKATETAMLASPSEVEHMRIAFHKRRDLMLKMLSEIPGIKTNTPDGAFYIFPDVSHYFGKVDGEKVIANSGDFCMYLLNDAHVALVAGEAFGSPNCVRISYAASEENLIEAVERIRKSLSKLK
ncbi:MAG: aspartate aminotransferase [Flavobacteriales bacterium]|jgi:aspartate aminotransferase|nr:aspartate aminotransferase [Flavobacteriales bacterium]|tara:strand:- start:23165 stop:24358 length:1194 start_codon:yes stop_codon:yes gene_type:complete